MPVVEIDLSATGANVQKQCTAPLLNPDTTTSTSLTDTTQRVLVAFPARPDMWRIRLRNVDMDGVAYDGSIPVSGVWLGNPTFPADGSQWDGVMSTAVQAVSAFTTPSNASDYVSEWVTDPALRPAGGKTMALSIAAHASVGTRIVNSYPAVLFTDTTGGTGASSQGAHTGAMTYNQSTIFRNFAAGVFDVRIEYKVTGCPHVLVVGDSIAAGGGVDSLSANIYPAHDTWPYAAGLRAGLAICNISVGGSAASQWVQTPPSAYRAWWWDRVDIATSIPDAMWIALGTNDVGNGASLASIKTALAGIVAYGRSLGIPRVSIATILPRNFSAGTNETKRLDLSTWIGSAPAGMRVMNLERAIADPANAANIDAVFDSGDHTHLNHRGYQRLAEVAAVGL